MSDALKKAFKEKIAQIKAENITQEGIDRATAAMRDPQGRAQAEADLKKLKSDKTKH
jgi:hypothetical protein